MKTWLIAICTFVVGCYTFWHLGKKDGVKNERLEVAKKRADTVSRACNARNNASLDGLRKKYRKQRPL